MPTGQADSKLKEKINQFYKDKRYTKKQYTKLSWNHLLQIGQYNHDNGRIPKVSDKSKTAAEWRAHKDKPKTTKDMKSKAKPKPKPQPKPKPKSTHSARRSKRLYSKDKTNSKNNIS